MNEITLNLYEYYNIPVCSRKGILHGFPVQGDEDKPVLLIIPGGSYSGLCYREDRPIALHFFNIGISSFYMEYSCGTGVSFPTALYECGLGLQYLRTHGYKNRKIIVMGFSAGGHLAGMLTNGLSRFCRDYPPFINGEIPVADGIVYGYPVVTTNPSYAHEDSIRNLLKEQYTALYSSVSLEQLITSDSCPAFIFHCMDDSIVPVENSIILADAYRRNEVSCELHLFPKGNHGIALPNRECFEEHEMPNVDPSLMIWVTLFHRWLDMIT